MSLVQTRGGWPHVFRAEIPTTGRLHDPKKWTSYLQVYAATNDVHLYFSQEDFDNDENYIVVEADESWEGPAEVRGVWFKAQTAAANVVAIFYQRRA
jgi:hypothetical protein